MPLLQDQDVNVGLVYVCDLFTARGELCSWGDMYDQYDITWWHYNFDNSATISPISISLYKWMLSDK